MSIKVITIVELEGLPEGSVLQDCIETEEDGVKCWYGVHASMRGTYHEKVLQEDCEIWEEEKHDPIARLFAKTYETERELDIPGEVPWRILKFQIRDTAKKLIHEETPNFTPRSSTNIQNEKYLLKALLVYKAKHYPDLPLDFKSLYGPLCFGHEQVKAEAVIKRLKEYES